MIKESFNEPNKNIGSKFIQLSDEDIGFINASDTLKNMINTERITLDKNNKLWYFDDDVSVVETLSSFFDLNESLSTFSDYMKEDVFYSSYDEMSEDIVDRIRKFIYDWKEEIDSSSIDTKGEFDINNNKYEYNISIKKVK